MVLVIASLVLMGAVLWMQLFEARASPARDDRATALTWEDDAATLVFAGPVVPHRVGFWTWLAVWGVVVGLAAAGVIALVLALEPNPLFAGIGAATTAVVAASLVLPAAGLVGFWDARYRVTCTLDGLVVRMPYARDQAFLLRDLDDIDFVDDALVLIVGGRRVSVPLPTGTAFDTWMGLLRASQRRAIAHVDDLHAAEVHREALRSVMRESARARVPVPLESPVTGSAGARG